MALSAQNSNFISRLQQMGERLLAEQREIQLMLAQWNQNDMTNALTDADIAAVFPHLTKNEVASAITAIEGVDTALGNLSSGQAVNLVKLRG